MQWFACLMCLFVFSPAILGQRFFDSGVVMGKLKPGHATNLVCPEAVPEIRFELSVSADGKVEEVKALEPHRLPVKYSLKAYRFLRDQAEAMVLHWSFRPMLLNKKRVPMRTVITVPCVQH